jgi:hypothetical protein
MYRNPTVRELLHDPTLSFTDFCIITSALKNGDTEEEILGMPELAHLRRYVDISAEAE